MIERVVGNSPPGRSTSSAYKDLVWTVATASNEALDLTGQTVESLDTLDKNLLELGSDKSRIISAQVFIANINDKPVLDAVWNEWIGGDPANWPQRACLGVDLGGNWLVEIVVTAVRGAEG